MGSITTRVWWLLTLAAIVLGLDSAPASAQKSLPKGFREKVINVEGVEINYKIGGRGPVVVLLHGYTQTSHMWIPLIPLLAQSHTVIAPDLRGAGGSERTYAGYDKKTLAKDIRGLVRQLGHEQVQLVGHDIGLMVAYAYAAYFIKKVYETDLLICPKCQGEMRIISFIDQPDVIKKILQHLGLWEEPRGPPDRSEEKEITFDPSYSQIV